jgi:hypothetical protein
MKTQNNTTTFDTKKTFGFTFETDNLHKRLQIVGEFLNPSKYEVIGFKNDGKKVVVRNRFHNVRNSKGQFVRVK